MNLYQSIRLYFVERAYYRACARYDAAARVYARVETDFGDAWERMQAARHAAPMATRRA